MFPNPQDALPLPPHADLSQYKKLAKDLVKICKTGSPDEFRRWAANWVDGLVRRSELEITPRLPVAVSAWANNVADFARRQMHSGDRPCALADAQFVLARSHGFRSWPKFVRHLEAAGRQDGEEARFEAAADAIISGDLETLDKLLRRQPGLARQRSAREHGATLLHYVSANGVEGYRQKTPKNIVDIAQLLLRAGAEVDAVADVYDGDCTTLGLVATSVHPREAGVQEPLLQLLLDHGAKIDQPGSAGRRASLVFACLANGQPQAARFLAQRGAPLDLETAAGIGDLALVRTFFDPDGSLRGSETREQLQRGLVWASGYGHKDVVEFLLERGADVREAAGLAQPPLHMAVVGGQVESVKLLLARGAATEQLNAYGGTALGQAVYSFVRGDPRTDYVPVFEALLAAGAKVDGSWIAHLESAKGRTTEERRRAAEVLRRH